MHPLLAASLANSLSRPTALARPPAAPQAAKRAEAAGRGRDPRPPTS